MARKSNWQIFEIIKALELYQRGMFARPRFCLPIWDIRIARWLIAISYSQAVLKCRIYRFKSTNGTKSCKLNGRNARNTRCRQNTTETDWQAWHEVNHWFNPQTHLCIQCSLVLFLFAEIITTFVRTTIPIFCNRAKQTRWRQVRNHVKTGEDRWR